MTIVRILLAVLIMANVFVLEIGAAKEPEVEGRASGADNPPASAPQPGESLASVRGQVQAMVARIQTLQCELELSQQKSKKKRKTKVGPMEIARGIGARLTLTRKSSTDEYIANEKIIWVYDHKDAEAKYIPTELPIINYFVNEALRLNVFLSVDEDTLKFRGSQGVEGEPCWVLEGSSPRRLQVVGVPVSKVLVWVSKNDGIPRKISLPHEEKTIIMLRDIKLNSAVAPARFSWDPPSGVKTKNVLGF